MLQVKGGLTSPKRSASNSPDLAPAPEPDSPPWDALRGPDPVPAPDAFFSSP